ncbi:MAG: PadR family transcriptional regulator [Acidobacteria bacterium]|nr:MAG: PadR family transcriptional regulator [Acidobacteriota bacterium]
MPVEKTDLLQGTLDMLVLKTLQRGALHGYDIARWIQQTSEDALQVEEGSLYPALYRMERRGWIQSRWGVSQNNRRARYYELTQTGRRQLQAESANWDRLITAIGKIMQTA